MSDSMFSGYSNPDVGMGYYWLAYAMIVLGLLWFSRALIVDMNSAAWVAALPAVLAAMLAVNFTRPFLAGMKPPKVTK